MISGVIVNSPTIRCRNLQRWLALASLEASWLQPLSQITQGPFLTKLIAWAYKMFL